MSNQARLFILVFLAFLPTLGLFTFADRSRSAAEIRHHETELLHLANRAGLEYSRILTDTESLLGALSEMEEFRNPRQPRCNQVLADIMQHMQHYTAIQLIEPDGFVTCGSLAIDESLFVGDRYYHAATVANNRFTVGDFVVGRLTGQPIVGLAHPVRGASRLDVSAVLAAYLDLNQLMNSVYEMDVPQGATLTMVDRRGTIMLRVPSGVSENGADTVGAKVSEAFPTPTGEIRGPYMLDGVDVDGVERRFAVEPLEAGGRLASGHLFIGMSPATMTADSDSTDVWQLRILAGAALFLFVIAWIFGHYTLLKDPDPVPAEA